MKRSIAVAAIAAAGFGAGVVRRFRSRPAQRDEEPNRWLAVTVNCRPEQLSEGEPPEPLARLATEIDIKVAAAPGGRGTELSARLREPAAAGVVGRVSGDDPRQRVRRALREVKSLLETGEIMRPDTPPTTRPTLRGKVVDLATRRAGGEGRL